MKVLIAAVATAALLASVAGSASADPYDRGHHSGYNQQSGYDQRSGYDQQSGYGHQYGDNEHRGWGREYGGSRHHWRRGQRMGYNDWNGAGRIDYREHHLRQPPRGYEWRESNGQYVLAAVATGLIASIILNSGR